MATLSFSEQTFNSNHLAVEWNYILIICSALSSLSSYHPKIPKIFFLLLQTIHAWSIYSPIQTHLPFWIFFLQFSVFSNGCRMQQIKLIFFSNLLKNVISLTHTFFGILPLLNKNILKTQTNMPSTNLLNFQWFLPFKITSSFI